MESIHVLEPIFHISPASSPLDGKSRTGGPRTRNILARAEKSAGNAAGKLALHLLGRLKIYSAPRIISAECFFTDTATTAGDCR